MTIFGRLRAWWQVQTGDEDTPFDGDTSAFLASLLFHMGMLLALGLIPLAMRDNQVTLTIAVPVEEPVLEELEIQREFAFSERSVEEMGANSAAGAEMAYSLASEISQITDVPSPVELPVMDGRIEIDREIQLATAQHFSRDLAVKGAAGEGVAGAEGAIDRLTQEILRSLEQRKTLVVWLFDQSASLVRQREAINSRFARIYEELGVIEAAGNPAFARREDKPLLTSVVAFGQNIKLLTPQPTDDLAEIQRLVAGIELDESGIEKVFSAVYMAADRYKHYRIRSPATDQPERNVMIVVFTDERGDDLEGLEPTVRICRRYTVPVYVVGVPAPFGREETLVKWVDPDPNYDQTPQWGRVNQGPESFMLERLQLPWTSGAANPDPMDSGFGPFALTRLCYETGGIYFAVHSSRNVYREVSQSETDAFSSHLKYFFDPLVMSRYRPDYVSGEDYLRRASANRVRGALVTAARKSLAAPEDPYRLRFVRRDEARLAGELTEAQKAPAKLEPLLVDLHQTLAAAEEDRFRETAPRWQAGYDLAMGQVLAALARTHAYNALLAELRRGKTFQDGRSNTWRIAPAAVGSAAGPASAAAEQASVYLRRVVKEHPGTPWAVLAQRELDAPLGWICSEEYTDLAPRTGRGSGGDGDDGRGDRRRPAEPAPQKRPLPKL